MTKVPVKINSEVRVISLEEAILILLDKKTPPAMTSQDISDELGSPYPTIHPKLKFLQEKGLIEGKEDQTPRPGKKRLLWAKGGDLNSVLYRWKEMVQGE